MAGCQSPDCSHIFQNYAPFWNDTLMENFTQVPPLESNPDVSGIGVIFAFLGTAYLTLIMVATHYLFVPQHSANPVDRSVLNGFWRLLIWASRGRASLPSEEFGRGLRGPILMFSDQQIVTGVGILVAGFYQMATCGLSSYHWQIVVYLAWFSSLTHLATLTLLRDYMVFNSGIRAFRLIMMLGLFVLLVVALLPTGSRLWLQQIFKYNDSYGMKVYDQMMSMPALCFFRAFWKVNSYHFYMGMTIEPGFTMMSYSSQMATMTVSLVFIVFNYSSRTIKLFKSSSKWSRRWFRTAPGNLAKRMMKRLSKVSNDVEKTKVQRCFAIMGNEYLLSMFTIALAICDLYESMFCEILFLFFALGWGTIRLFLTRSLKASSASHEFLIDENSWNFGQILPCMLLVLPILSVGETFYETSNEKKIINVATISTEPAPQQPHCCVSTTSFSSSISLTETEQPTCRRTSLTDVVIHDADHVDIDLKTVRPPSPHVRQAKLTWLYGESLQPTSTTTRISLRDRTHPVNFYAFTWFRDLQAMLTIDFCVVAVEMLLFDALGATDPFKFAFYTSIFAVATVASLLAFVIIQIVLMDNDEEIMLFFEKCGMKREKRSVARKWFRAILWILFAALEIYLFATMPISQTQPDFYNWATD